MRNTILKTISVYNCIYYEELNSNLKYGVGLGNHVLMYKTLRHTDWRFDDED